MSARNHPAATIAIGVLLVFTSCSSGGDDAARSSGRSASSSATSDAAAAVTVAEAQAITRSYDTANNAAIKASGSPPYDEKAWGSADAGPALVAGYGDRACRQTLTTPQRTSDCLTPR